MPEERTYRLEITDFRHGLNTENAAHEIQPTQSPDLQNVDLSQQGITKTRAGIAKLNSTEYPSATGIFGAGYGKSVHLAAALTTVKKMVAGAYTDVKTGLTSNSQTFFEEWNNYVYSVNGADAPFKWDGTTATAITSPPSDWTTTKPNYICEHENRLWTLTASTSKVHWSKLDDGNEWSTTVAPDDAGAHSFRPNDGYTGTGIVSQKSGVVIFKQNSIHKILGKTPVSFRFLPLYTTIGCIAPRSIVNVENRLFFLAKYKGDYGVYVVDDAGGLTHLSGAITPKLNTLIDAANESLCAGVNYQEKYRLSFPISGGWRGVNLNYKTGGWEFDNGNAMRCGYTVGNSLYGGGTGNGYVYTLESGTADDTSAIVSYVKSKNYFMGFPDRTKLVKTLFLWTKASGNYNLAINLYVDDKLYPNSFYTQLGTKGSTETMRFDKIPLNADVQGSMIALKMGTSTINQPFEIYKAVIYYEIGDITTN